MFDGLKGDDEIKSLIAKRQRTTIGLDEKKIGGWIILSGKDY